jgi:hypothetical protein
LSAADQAAIALTAGLGFAIAIHGFRCASGTAYVVSRYFSHGEVNYYTTGMLQQYYKRVKKRGAKNAKKRAKTRAGSAYSGSPEHKRRQQQKRSSCNFNISFIHA